MKTRLVMLIIFYSYSLTVMSQPKIEITIDANEKVAINFYDSAKISYDKLDFSKSSGKLTVVNATPNKYKITFISIVDGNEKHFILPGKDFPVGSKDEPRQFSWDIEKGGSIKDIQNAIFTSNLTIKVEGGTPTKELAKFSTENKSDNDDNAREPRRSSITKIQAALREYVQNQIDDKGYKYVSSQNIIIDARGIVHIYLDQNLSSVYAYYPTTAKGGYDKFQFHILSTDDFTYTIESAGKFEVEDIKNDIDDVNFPKVQGTGKQAIFEYTSSIFGPYSNSFPFLIQRYKNKQADIELERSIKLIKVDRVSLNVGLVSTWLRNPENLNTFVLPSGDTTLIADFPDVRGMVVAMLSFHLKPRNLNIPPRTFNERIGLSLGLALNKKIGTNVFAGLNIEAANGLFLNGGVHFGEINYPIEHPEFEFGKERFSGLLVTKKRWNVRPYLGLSIDAGLFVKAFRSLFVETSASGSI